MLRPEQSHSPQDGPPFWGHFSSELPRTHCAMVSLSPQARVVGKMAMIKRLARPMSALGLQIRRALDIMLQRTEGRDLI